MQMIFECIEIAINLRKNSSIHAKLFDYIFLMKLAHIHNI